MDDGLGKDVLICIAILFAVSFVFTLGVIHKNQERLRKYNQAIAECEAELPRNQKCKVVGVIDNDQ